MSSKIEPCPWCRTRKPEVVCTVFYGSRVMCILARCQASGPWRDSNNKAIAAWNRVARPAKEKT